MTTPVQQESYVHIPDTVSQQAQAFLRTLRDPALMPAFPEPDDLAGWEKVRAFAEADGKAKSAPLLQRYEHTVTAGRLGGVPVLDVRPKNWKDNGKVAVYTHGGAHVMYSAASTLGRAVVFAHATDVRVLSIDYTVAPLAKYNQMSDEVIRAISALLKDGQRLAHTVIYGDSSGAGNAGRRRAGLSMGGCDAERRYGKYAARCRPEPTLREAQQICSRCFRQSRRSKRSVCVAGLWRLFQRISADAHPGWFEGDPA